MSDARQDTITLTNATTGEQVTTLPSSTSHPYGVSAMEPGAVRLVGAASPVVPVGAVVLLKADGDWHHVRTVYGHRNYYLHFEYKPVRFDAETNEHVEDLPEPAEPQKETLARWFFRGETPYGIPLGDPVMRWAFAGTPPGRGGGALRARTHAVRLNGAPRKNPHTRERRRA